MCASEYLNERHNFLCIELDVSLFRYPIIASLFLFSLSDLEAIDSNKRPFSFLPAQLIKLGKTTLESET